jgi:FAD-dependent oxidoreductase domain-containing protein 1
MAILAAGGFTAGCRKQAQCRALGAVAHGLEADVVIAGGAVIGSATAYYLKKLGFDGSVRVIEKDPTYARCCTTRSAGGIRQQFSTEENIRLSQFGLKLIRDIKQEFGAQADVAFREQGYLILVTPEGRRGSATSSPHKDGSARPRSARPGPARSRAFDWLALDGLAAGAFGERNEGWLDPWSLMSLFRHARWPRRHLADGRDRRHRGDAGKVSAVRLADGGRIACGALVNAAGADAGALAGLAGIELPVGRRKRYVYVFDCREFPARLHAAPLTIDPTGVYFRPEGAQFICGLSPEEHEEPEVGDDDIDYAWFEERIWPVLAARVPVFEAIKLVNAWSCHYDYNALDQNAVIGRHPELANFYFCNGFSGHGLQQAPGAGNAIAELIVHGRFVTIDLARFGYERIAERRPLKEINVI